MIRTRICFYILIFTPLLVYWQTTFSDYGLRDDYSYLREAREEPGKLVQFTASHGRPLYGALLETTFANLDEISRLCWLRLTTVLLMTGLGLALWRQLYQSGWTEIEAAVIGLSIVLLPASQVITSWAMCWPHALALLLSLAGFAATEAELERGGLKRAIAVLGGVMIYALAALIYQPNALFAVVPIAAVLLVRTGREPATDIRWGLLHLLALIAGLFIAYMMIGALFAYGIFHESTRMQVETNPFTKLGWFLWQPLPNALGLYALRDNFNTGAVVFWCTAAVVTALIGWGYRSELERSGGKMKWKMLLCMVGMPFVAHVVSLAAAERAIGYRVLFALSGLVIVLLVFALRSLRAAGRLKPFLYQIGLVSIVLIAAVTAHVNAHLLIAEPQGYEWETVRTAVMKADLPKQGKIYVIRPALQDRATLRIFSDEFGSLSGDSDWAPQEMVKAALRERFPTKPANAAGYTVTSGKLEPNEKAYDLVIDMRKYKERAER